MRLGLKRQQLRTAARVGRDPVAAQSRLEEKEMRFLNPA